MFVRNTIGSHRVYSQEQVGNYLKVFSNKEA